MPISNLSANRQAYAGLARILDCAHYKGAATATQHIRQVPRPVSHHPGPYRWILFGLRTTLATTPPPKGSEKKVPMDFSNKWSHI